MFIGLFILFSQLNCSALIYFLHFSFLTLYYKQSGGAKSQLLLLLRSQQNIQFHLLLTSPTFHKHQNMNTIQSSSLPLYNEGDIFSQFQITCSLFPSAYTVGDSGLIPLLERSLGGVNGYPLQYSCLENFMDRGTWWVAKSQTQLSN